MINLITTKSYAKPGPKKNLQPQTNEAEAPPPPSINQNSTQKNKP